MNDKDLTKALIIVFLGGLFVGSLIGAMLGMDHGYKNGQIDYQRDIVKYEIRADGTIWELQQNTGGE